MAVPNAFATGASSQNLGTSTRVTIGDMTFDSSPNVSISCFTSNTAYSLAATNILTNTTVGKSYGTLSVATGYASRDKVAGEYGDPGTAVVTVLSAVDALTGSDWTWMGGSGE